MDQPLSGSDRSKYWGNILLSGLVVVLAWVAAMRHEIPWSWVAVTAALCLGWMTPAVVIDGFRLYVRALNAASPTAAAAQSLAVSVSQSNDHDGPGGGSRSVVVAAANTTGRRPSLPGPEVPRIEPPPPGTLPRMSWPSPGFFGLAEWLKGHGLGGPPAAGAAAVALVLLLSGFLHGCASSSGSRAGTTAAAVASTSAVLREVADTLNRAAVEERAAVASQTPPPAGTAERLARLDDATAAAGALRAALEVWSSATGAARDLAGCQVRTIGDRIVTTLVHVLAFLSDAGLPIPPIASLAVQGGGLVLDLVAPSCASGGARPAAGAYRWAVGSLRSRALPVEPLPPSWRAAFAPQLGASR